MELPLWLYWEGTAPAFIELCAETIQHHHPNVRRLDALGFEALRRSDRDLGLSHLKLNHKADYARAYLLQEYGGIWLDIDCVLFRSLEPFLQALEICDYIGYREPKYQDPQLGLMASRAHGRIISRHYRKVADFLRSGARIEWLSLSSWPMNEALAEESWQGYLQLDRQRVIPLHWEEHGRFFERGTESEHARAFRENVLCYMLYNSIAPDWFRKLSRAEILEGPWFVSYLFRRALGMT